MYNKPTDNSQDDIASENGTAAEETVKISQNPENEPASAGTEKNAPPAIDSAITPESAKVAAFFAEDLRLIVPIFHTLHYLVLLEYTHTGNATGNVTDFIYNNTTPNGWYSRLI